MNKYFSVLFFGACAIYFISEYDIGSFEEEKGTTVTDGRGNKYLFKENIINTAQNLTSLELKKYKYDWYSPGIRAQLFDTELLKLENDIIIKNRLD